MVKLSEKYANSGRTVLDSYLLNYNKASGEVSVTQARNALQHFNVTEHAFGVSFSDEFRLFNTYFNYHDEAYQPSPWLKAYYSLNNWNNTQEEPPPY